ncbi:MAG TPA: hypothetical protein PK747_05575 [Acidobacteriota bacterium]|nr:hypothetical protein [Acidobacteriota bacterium]HNT17462.1 hypothetical protein [Acidobacteriota bacterium]HPA26182.1 hypothetical protein [Acidobacteriota bacterium]HQO18740.1 hypothetical protein [Acidobacteriota bacterium]HQQ46865.1 hypothetical protein [Acidobacteriota bacterium]
MKKILIASSAMLFCLFLLNVPAAEKDAPGCKDSPIAPRLAGYYIMGCSSDDAVADFDLLSTGAIHVEGKSVAILYALRTDLKNKKPTESSLKADFENMMKKQGGALVATSPGQKWPVYKLSREGKEYWIVLMVDPGDYFTGSYGVRVIEKK